MKPFIHKFETARNKYVYDVNSNSVFKVSPVVYDIVSEFQEGGLKDLFSKFSGRGKKELRQAYINMTGSLQRNGLFFCPSPHANGIRGGPSD